MRKLLPPMLLVLAGCGYGPSRLKPGSDMAVPRKIGLAEAVLGALACSAQTRDSIQKTPGATTTAGKDQIRTNCGALRDTIKR
jgi:hypothetical protein